ncbi:YccF domain-containing protein [Catalinimonas niigatensis]|uniref:YccF domain-containing protein n=1 Tax=Catalinimonas niigatensis TaxID=1397264 RepID=UPI002665E4F3|nr:YccF domain-containing protein [Catalinimonas niigatensis]WPP48390.1 YccF domain-containing protein [Catalinimonas niigatensis]
MNVIGNILWIILGGFAVALEYLIAGVLMCLTIIGIPFGIQSFKLAGASLWPFGNEVKPTPKSGSGFSTLLNVIWILLGGIWITLTHVVLGVVLCITIIGIPFGLQHFKLMRLSFTPFGYEFGDVRPG